ncbi:MAG TPA: ComEA family DNA-binding protein [Candidatus Dormibacteraeota bacterium]|jgi:competence protein ComEA|nr:ComEA family DNA-binding protein [Candidatus Dormibacteraeota bacterium]
MRNHLTVLPGWKRILALTLPVLLGLGAVIGVYVVRAPAATNPAPVSTSAAAAAAANADVPAPAGLLVHVVGAVEHPGLYRMKRGDRVYDAIAAAGGLSVEADITRLPNLAGRLKDGEQVKVPYSKGSAGATVVTRVNLNTATVEELEVVPGFSTAFAQDVIDYRTNFGGFQNTRELVDILGMSEADYVLARRYLTL